MPENKNRQFLDFEKPIKDLFDEIGGDSRVADTRNVEPGPFGQHFRLVVRLPEVAGDADRVPGQDHTGVWGGHRPDRRLEDRFRDAGGFVRDQEHVGGVFSG